MDDTKEEIKTHKLIRTTFSKFTRCDHCDKFLWGLVKQGLTCQKCGFVCHPTCLKDVEKLPSDFTNSSLTKDNDVKPTLDTIFKDVIQQAANHKKQLRNVREQPKLGLLTTTPQNFTKFITRITPMRLGYEQLLSLITWEYPYKTWIFLSAYCLFCYRPLWILLLPHLGFWYYLGNSYIKAYRKEENKILLEEVNQEDKDKASPTMIYAQNMQFVQNLMGTYTEVYSYFTDNWEVIEQKLNSPNAVLFTGIGLPLSFLIVYLIPLNYIFMMGGCVVLLSNNPLMLAIFVTLSPLLVDELSTHLGRASKVFSASGLGSPDIKTGIRPRIKEVFENQRWWAILGWKEQLLATERPLWSNFKGDEEYSAIYNQSADQDFQWATEGWQIDTTWCKPIQPDKDGWVYYNNLWEGPSNSPRIDSFTRRRLWCRKMMPLTKEKVPTPAEIASTIPAKKKTFRRLSNLLH
ncbi:hypothetical protein K502DRAFT_315161 [Neoconidiobolus thromboides FSU 785]|nr:hypothetical protein K502DRAFT_315161 [Neoconidiobolus thromboides FSU 785]